jgi:hypothetical protein
MPKLPKIAEISKLRVSSIVNFGNSGGFGNCKSVKEYQKVEFDSATRSVYFLKFARPHESLEVKH